MAEPDADAPQDPTAGLLPPAEERPHRARGPSAGPLLVAFGLAFFAMALSTSFMATIEGMFGFQRLVATALGFLFLYTAWASRGVAHLRERLLDLAEEMLKIFYGPDFRREREAVDILIRAMASDKESVRRSTREHLVRLTGQDLGEDQDAWARWWESNRSTFRAPPPRGETDAND